GAGRRRGPAGVFGLRTRVEDQRQDGTGRAQGARRVARSHRRLPPPDPDPGAQPGDPGRPVSPPLPGWPGAVRDPGGDRPAHVHVVRDADAHAHLPQVPGAAHPGALRVRADAAEAAGPAEVGMSWTHIVEALLVLTGAVCLISGAVWARTSRRLHRAWQRVADTIDEQGMGADAAELARSAFRKEVHTAGMYFVIGVAALVLAGTAPRTGTLVVLGVLAPVLATFRYGPRFLHEARMAEQRAALVRRAEEVLS